VRPTLYQRRKALYPVVFWLGMAGSVGAHWALFSFAPTIRGEIGASVAAPLVAIELPPQVDIPPPPARIARPALPVVSARTDISEDITIAPTVFSDYTPPELLPPPPPQPISESTSAGPAFTPYTKAPVLQNPDEVTRAITANYPRTLRDAEIGGDVVLWFYIDEEGRVLETRVAEGSGYAAMDQAAVSVAEVFRFRPAYNRDLPAKVWVQIPIMFRVRGR
jgi:TonB family protein